MASGSYSRSSDASASTVGDRVVLYHRTSRAALVLNPTGSWMWQQLDHPEEQRMPSPTTSAIGFRHCLRRRRRDVEPFLADLAMHAMVSVIRRHEHRACGRGGRRHRRPLGPRASLRLSCVRPTRACWIVVQSSFARGCLPRQWSRRTGGRCSGRDHDGLGRSAPRDGTATDSRPIPARRSDASSTSAVQAIFDGPPDVLTLHAALVARGDRGSHRGRS